MISTQDLSDLPDVDRLRRLMQSLAMLDAILSPQWEHRYFSFNTHWAPGKQMGSMRNGQGDHYFALFNGDGCWLKGFAREVHEPSVDVFVGVPVEFAKCLTEPAFVIEEATFCIWRRYGDSHWKHGPMTLPDGSAELLRLLDGRPETYHEWAEDYFEGKISAEAIRLVYAHQSLSESTVNALNAKVSLVNLDADINETGYPNR